MNEFNIEKHGEHNEKMQSKKGYCQCVSALCEMTAEYDAMFTSEAKYWLEFKRANPLLWKSKLKRLKTKRGTIFVDRLLKCINWLNKKGVPKTVPVPKITPVPKTVLLINVSKHNYKK
jgi:hypothetical protein